MQASYEHFVPVCQITCKGSCCLQLLGMIVYPKDEAAYFSETSVIIYQFTTILIFISVMIGRVNCRLYKSISLDIIVCQIKLIYIISFCFLKKEFNICLLADIFISFIFYLKLLINSHFHHAFYMSNPTSLSCTP
jgi:hypothetical protein